MAVAGDASKYLGAYRLESLLGRGGMGEVFLAWDERLERHVAVKRILPEPPPDQRARRRFRREARAVARLSHPAIVQVFDLFDHGGYDCLVMEYVEGHDLGALIAAGELGLDTVLGLGAEIADGLAEAHARGLVHRDLKPGNVRVTRSEHAKILDFGLARLAWNEGLDGDSISEVLTEWGTLIGTVHAMSPEQIRGRPVDYRADLFALGSLLYEMLTGHAPLRGANVLDTLRRITGEEPAALTGLRPDLPSSLVALVHDLLAKEPAERPPNARVVAEALGRLRAASAGDRTAGPIPPLPAGPTPRYVDPDIADLPTGEMPAPGAVGIDTAVCTLWIAELVDAPRLVVTEGEVRATEIFAHHDRRVRDLLERHGGQEVDKSGGFLCLFKRPSDAVACGLAYQRSIAELEAELGVGLPARSAVHLGEVVLRHNPPEEVKRGARPLEVEGQARSLAARLAALASPRQTLLTRAAFDLARRAATTGEDLCWLAHGTYRVAGVEESVEVFEVGVEGFAPLVEPPDSPFARRTVPFSEELVLGWRPASGQTVPVRPHWVLAERLGEGGFGEVWLAVHESGEKRVFKFCFEASRLRALKREVTLFRLLKDALGHRHDIARVLDWNFDVAPYFLEVEHTEGGDLAAWAAARGGIEAVPLATRLDLLAQVADALAAAHSVGVLHKDVKPENVLITRDPEGRPRVLLTDFGIGALVDRSQLEARGVPALGFTETLTEEPSTAGSRRYLAPELLEGKPASVEADVYSLGVLLYQVVVGDFSRALAPGWRRDIGDEILCEDIAAAVDGSPSRRLSSAVQLAERLRSLAERRAALEAERRARQRAERTRRQRRILAVALVVVAIFSLVVSAMAWRVAREAERAEREAEAARQVAAFLVEMFEVSNPYAGGPAEAPGGTVTARDILDRGARRLRTELGDQPEIRARLMNTVGRVYAGLAFYDSAQALFEEALALRRKSLGEHPAVAESLADLAWLFHLQGDHERAEVHYREALAVHRRTLGEDHPYVADDLSNLAWVLQAQGDYDAAEEYAREALAIKRRLLGEGDRAVAASLGHLAFLLHAQGDYDAAEPFAREALAITRSLWDEHPDVAESLNGMARVLLGKGDPEAAEPLAREALAMRRRLLGDEHPSVAQSLHDLAWVLLAREDYEAAEELFLESLPKYRRIYGEESPAVAMNLKNLVHLYEAWGRPEKAAEYRARLATASESP